MARGLEGHHLEDNISESKDNSGGQKAPCHAFSGCLTTCLWTEAVTQENLVAGEWKWRCKVKNSTVLFLHNMCRAMIHTLRVHDILVEANNIRFSVCSLIICMHTFLLTQQVQNGQIGSLTSSKFQKNFWRVKIDLKCSVLFQLSPYPPNFNPQQRKPAIFCVGLVSWS
jgi:hypothetical protein